MLVASAMARHLGGGAVLALASAPRPLPWGHPLLYDWSAEGQKLYAWLRVRVEERGPAIAGPPPRLPSPAPPDVDDPARAVDTWRARGYLATYATADQIIESALPVSRNTVTKLVAELLERRVCVPRRVRRGGHVFLLGEWGIRRSPLLDADLYWQCYYLDGLLGASVALAPADVPIPGRAAKSVARGLVPRRGRHMAAGGTHPQAGTRRDEDPVPPTAPSGPNATKHDTNPAPGDEP